MKAVVTAFNQVKALVGDLFAILYNFNLRECLFEALISVGSQLDCSLPPTLLSGVVWHHSGGLFSRWREVFLILNRDGLRWHHIQRTASINHHQACLSLYVASSVSSAHALKATLLMHG